MSFVQPCRQLRAVWLPSLWASRRYLNHGGGSELGGLANVVDGNRKCSEQAYIFFVYLDRGQGPPQTSALKEVFDTCVESGPWSFLLSIKYPAPIFVQHFFFPLGSHPFFGVASRLVNEEGLD